MSDPSSSIEARRAAAEAALTPRLAGSVMWMVPPGDRHFDAISLAKLAAKALMDAFLAALVKDAAKRAIDWLMERIGAHFKGPSEPPADVVAAIVAAPQALAAMSDAAAEAARAEAELVTALRSTMPEAEARKVAAAVREEALKHVFAGDRDRA